MLQDPRTAPGPTPVGKAAEFAWAKHWYGVGAARDLDPTRPHALTLLGKNLVIWKAIKTGQGNCLEDRCPHRAAPLSGAMQLVGNEWLLDGKPSGCMWEDMTRRWCRATGVALV